VTKSHSWCLHPALSCIDTSIFLQLYLKPSVPICFFRSLFQVFLFALYFCGPLVVSTVVLVWQCTLHSHNEQFFQVGLLDRALTSLGLDSQSFKIVPDMTYNVFGGTLNLTVLLGNVVITSSQCVHFLLLNWVSTV